MLNENNYVINSFSQHFKQCCDKKIVIYGLGRQTQVLLEKFTDYNIAGLMDPVRTGEIVYGKRVLSYEEVVSIGIDLIIILARQSNVKIIYHRIEEFCKTNKIKVFDINGKDLMNQDKVVYKDNQYYKVSEKLLKDEIKKYNIISFDIFDTLLMRKVLYPQDIFELVEQRAISRYGIGHGFCRNRIKAELSLCLETVPNINEIYRKLGESLNLSDIQLKQLLDLEIELEKENLLPRYILRDIFLWAVESGKRVFLVTDMYLPQLMLEKILKDFGIDGYENIYISCEIRLSKNNGLFNKLIEDVGTKNILHIGDNDESDGNMAKATGIAPFLIKSSLDMLEISRGEHLLSLCKTLEDRLILGAVISRALNNPFLFSATKGKFMISTCEDLGYILVAPIITVFTYWLASQAKGSDNLLLLASRDGYLIFELYKKFVYYYKKETFPKFIYFMASRAACVVAGLKNEDDIIEAARLAFSGKPDKMLKDRFLLEDTEIMPYIEGGNSEEYILAHKGAILKKASEYRENYMIYIQSLNIDSYKQVYFFDFVSSGTCQLYLENIIQKKLNGLYFSRISEDGRKQSLKIKSLYKMHSIYECQEFTTGSYIFLENIMTSLESTLKYFDRVGNPVLFEEERSKNELNAVQKIHDGIIEFFDDFIHKCTDINISLNLDLADHILKLLQPQNSKILDNAIRDGKMLDRFCNREFAIWDSII